MSIVVVHGPNTWGDGDAEEPEGFMAPAALGGGEEEGDGGEEGDDELFDPADYTVAEVMEYAEANPDQVDDLIAAEQAGKNRSTLISQLEALQQQSG